MNTVYIVDYDDLIKSYEYFMRYSLEQSEFCSLITLLKKESRNSSKTIHDKRLQSLKPLFHSQIEKIKKWSNGGTRNDYTVMKIYKCKSSYTEWEKCDGNFLLPEKYKLPKDIAFYRKKVVWLATISHENLAFLYNPTESDLQFFKDNNIKYYQTMPMSIYSLPI